MNGPAAEEEAPPLLEEGSDDEDEDSEGEEVALQPVMDRSWEADYAACPRWDLWWRQALAGGVDGSVGPGLSRAQALSGLRAVP
jgi:hypothetical protein